MFTTTIETLYQRAPGGLRIALNGQDLMMAEKVTSDRGQAQIQFVSRTGESFVFAADAVLEVGRDSADEAWAQDVESGRLVALRLLDQNFRPWQGN